MTNERRLNLLPLAPSLSILSATDRPSARPSIWSSQVRFADGRTSRRRRRRRQHLDCHYYVNMKQQRLAHTHAAVTAACALAASTTSPSQPMITPSKCDDDGQDRPRPDEEEVGGRIEGGNEGGKNRERERGMYIQTRGDRGTFKKTARRHRSVTHPRRGRRTPRTAPRRRCSPWKPRAAQSLAETSGCPPATRSCPPRPRG